MTPARKTPEELTLPACLKCGQEYDRDPEGSPGVLVHLGRDGSVDYDRDRDHVPWPEGDE